MDWTWYLFRFDGRINRAKLWLALLIVLCWLIFLALLTVGLAALVGGIKPANFGFGIDNLFEFVDPASYRSLTWADIPVLVFRIASSLLLLWVYIATSIKRLHDRDKSGWWMVAFFVVPGLFKQFEDRLPDSYFMMLPGLAVFVLCIWGFVEMFCLKGSRKTNRFGADPLAPPDTRPAWDQQDEIEMVPRKAGPPPVWRVKPGYE